MEPASSTPEEASRKRKMEDIEASTETPSLEPPVRIVHGSVESSSGSLFRETSPLAASPPMMMQPHKTPRTDKAYKGLRHFSMMVCKKVEEKGTTSYNEVADELVQAVVQQRRQQNPDAKYDEKNIRRRVYDALNVLMAMDIITKDKKEITWKGLPSAATQDLDMLQREVDFRREEIRKKRDALVELLVQQVCFRNLATHNQKREVEQATAKVAKEGRPPQDNKIPLPFIVVNTSSSAVIQCNMSRDLTDVKFDFSSPFEINDDNTILKKLGMNETSEESLQEWLPEEIFQYCQENNLMGRLIGGEKPSASALKGAVATSDYKPPFEPKVSPKP